MLSMYHNVIVFMLLIGVFIYFLTLFDLFHYSSARYFREDSLEFHYAHDSIEETIILLDERAKRAKSSYLGVTKEMSFVSCVVCVSDQDGDQTFRSI